MIVVLKGKSVILPWIGIIKGKTQSNCRDFKSPISNSNKVNDLPYGVMNDFCHLWEQALRFAAFLYRETKPAQTQTDRRR